MDGVGSRGGERAAPEGGGAVEDQLCGGVDRERGAVGPVGRHEGEGALGERGGAGVVEDGAVEGEVGAEIGGAIVGEQRSTAVAGPYEGNFPGRIHGPVVFEDCRPIADHASAGPGDETVVLDASRGSNDVGGETVVGAGKDLHLAAAGNGDDGRGTGGVAVQGAGKPVEVGDDEVGAAELAVGEGVGVDGRGIKAPPGAAGLVVAGDDDVGALVEVAALLPDGGSGEFPGLHADLGADESDGI